MDKMKAVEAQIAGKMAQIAAIQEELKVLRAQKKAIMDEVPRCRNCKRCIEYYRTYTDCLTHKEHERVVERRCNILFTVRGTHKMVQKSQRACDRYERGTCLRDKIESIRL